jgi:hypothetical protein
MELTAGVEQSDTTDDDGFAALFDELVLDRWRSPHCEFHEAGLQMRAALTALGSARRDLTSPQITRYAIVLALAFHAKLGSHGTCEGTPVVYVSTLA